MSYINALCLFIYTQLYSNIWIVIVYYIATHAIYTYYFWASELPRPILCMLPFYRLYAYRQLSGQSIIPMIGIVPLTLMLYTGFWFWWLLYLVVAKIIEYQFAAAIVPTPFLYTFSNTVKYYYFISEGRSLADTGEED